MAYVVECLASAIRLSAEPDLPLVCMGGEVTYTYRISNPGTYPLTNLALSDPGATPFTPASGDLNTNGLLDTDEVWLSTCTTNLFADTLSVLTVTAADLAGTVVTNTATSFVDVDIESPALTPPPHIAIQCNESTAPGNTGVALATDLGGIAALVFADAEAPGPCGDARIITRTWTATDICGNATLATQLIEVVDTLAPALTLPPDIMIAPDASRAPAHTGQATATDNCSVQVDFTDSLTNSPSNFLLIRTWSAHDACGNLTEGDQFITLGVVAQIVAMERAGDQITLRSISNQDWPVQPQTCADLLAGGNGWTNITPFVNALQTTTNVTGFLNPAPHEDYRIFRIIQFPPE